MKLYEISEHLQNLIDSAIDEGTGEFNERFADELDRLQGDLHDKALNIGAYIVGMQRFSDSIKLEIEKHQKRRKGIESQIAYLKDYLQHNLKNSDTIQDERVRISFRKSERVHLNVPDSEIDERFRLEFTTYKAAKDEIKKHIKSGGIVSGCELRTYKNIQIK